MDVIVRDIGSPAEASVGLFDVPSLPPFPFELEGSTHISIPTSLISAEALMALINEVMHKAGADFEYNVEKCKWKGAVYKSGAFVKFRIFLYHKWEEDNEIKGEEGCYIVEFQRRHGEPVNFMKLYREEFVQALVERGLIERSSGELESLPHR